MSLRELDGVVGAPWARPLAGVLDQLVVESDALADNPLGDPARRPLYVYRPPGVELDHPKPLPSVYVIQGFTGQIDMWLSRSAFEPTMVERVDAMFAARACPDAILVFVDAWTSRGGSQFINSASTGRYLDYLCDEVVPFVDERYPTISSRDHRGLSGKSSGGYGAMVVPMLRPDVFGALASHAGDALFESCYLPAFREVVRILRDHFDGSYEVFFERLRHGRALRLRAPRTPVRDVRVRVRLLARTCPSQVRRCCRSIPLPGSSTRTYGRCGSSTTRCAWPTSTPTPCAACTASTSTPARVTSSTSTSVRRRSPHELSKIGAAHTLELFDGKHGGITYRYPGAIRELVTALQA